MRDQEAIVEALKGQMDIQDEDLPDSIFRNLGLVWLEGWFDIPAALLAPTSTLPLNTRVEKIGGSSWRGRIVGTYSTTLTPEGYCVESENEPGSVQIYPVKALRRMEEE